MEAVKDRLHFLAGPDPRADVLFAGSQAEGKRPGQRFVYNGDRPRSSLKYLIPAATLPHSPQGANGCATPTSSADRPLLHHWANKKPETLIAAG